MLRPSLDGSGLLEVEVRDRGPWRPPAADPGLRGPGLRLMIGLMEDVRVEPGPEGTVVRMPRQLTGDAGTPRPAAVVAGPASPGPVTVRPVPLPEGGLAVRLSGEVDAGTAPGVHSLVRAALRSTAGTAVVDLGAVTYPRQLRCAAAARRRP